MYILSRRWLQPVCSLVGLVFVVLVLEGCTTPPDAQAPDTSLPRSTPEAQGVSSEQLLAFLDAIEAEHRRETPRVEVHSVMVVRNGHVITEGWWDPYAANYNHMLFSLSKSFTSTAVGFAIDEGYFTLDDRVVDFFPDDAPVAPSDTLMRLTVRHLLTMSAGHESENRTSANWVRSFFEQPMVREPGSTFHYNSLATFMLSALVQQMTGETLMAYLTPRLFEPLGIDGALWVSSPRGINTGGWGLNLITEAITKFGLLYLQNGQWNGEQVVPAWWVEAATASQIETRNPATSDVDAATNDWAQGYGYKFWQTTHNAYRGDGAFGQFALVLPEQNAVVALTSGSRDMQAELNLIWDHLLPAFLGDPLPEDATTQALLRERLASLTLMDHTPNTASPLAAEISGQPFDLEANDLGLQTLTLTFTDTGCVLDLAFDDATAALPCGLGTWAYAEPQALSQIATPGIFRPTSYKTAASGEWTYAATFVMHWYYYETPFSDTITLRFDDTAVSADLQRNVGGLSERLTGRKRP